MAGKIFALLKEILVLLVQLLPLLLKPLDLNPNLLKQLLGILYGIPKLRDLLLLILYLAGRTALVLLKLAKLLLKLLDFLPDTAYILIDKCKLLLKTCEFQVDLFRLLKLSLFCVHLIEDQLFFFNLLCQLILKLL